jgi:hypothetical protein
MAGSRLTPEAHDVQGTAAPLSQSFNEQLRTVMAGGEAAEGTWETTERQSSERTLPDEEEEAPELVAMLVAAFAPGLPVQAQPAGTGAPMGSVIGEYPVVDEPRTAPPSVSPPLPWSAENGAAERLQLSSVSMDSHQDDTTGRKELSAPGNALPPPLPSFAVDSVSPLSGDASAPTPESFPDIAIDIPVLGKQDGPPKLDGSNMTSVIGIGRDVDTAWVSTRVQTPGKRGASGDNAMAPQIISEVASAKPSTEVKEPMAERSSLLGFTSNPPATAATSVTPEPGLDLSEALSSQPISSPVAAGDPGSSTGPSPGLSANLAGMPTPMGVQGKDPHLPDPVLSSSGAILEPISITVPVDHPAWDNALGQQVLVLAQQNGQQAELRLHPPELGSLEVHVSLLEDQANVTFSSPHAYVREVLESSVPRLRQMFTDAGLTLINVSVSQDSSAQQHYQGQGNDAPQILLSEQFSTADLPAEETALSRDDMRRGLVDYYA